MARSIFARLAAMVAAAAIGISGLLIAASPAAAADSCRDNSKEFAQYATVYDVTVQLCVHSDVISGQRQVWSTAHVTWTADMRPTTYAMFDKWEFSLRVEYNDAVKTSFACYPKQKMNDYTDGSYDCHTGKYPYSGSPYWTADTTVRYNYNLDGVGDSLWNLTGTPRI